MEIKSNIYPIVYLASDDQELIHALTMQLMNARYNIRHIVDANNLADACKKEMPAIIIVDAEAFDGDLSAINVINNLKENINCQAIIFFISKKDNIEDRLASAHAGVDRFFCKPVKVEKLINSLDSLIALSTANPYQVMLIVDDTDLRKHCEKLLQAEGMKVDSLSDPLKTFHHLTKFNPNVIVIDANMPENLGADLVHMIRLDDEWAMKPIILLSNVDEPDKKLIELKLGSDDFLSKPINPNHLVTTVLSRATRSRWTNRLNKNLGTILTENHFQIATMNEHNIVSTADVTGRITFVNDKFCDISGYSREELIGHNHRLLKSDLHDQKFYDDMWSNISQGNIWRGTIGNRRKDGAIYWVESTIVPFLNDRGKPYKYVSARTDVTALRESEERLRRSQSFANIGSWEWDIETGSVFLSDHLKILVDLDENITELTYDTLLSIVHPDDMERVLEAVSKCIKEGIEYFSEHRVIWRDGSSHWIQDKGNVERDKNGRAVTLFSMFQDIDNQKRAELALIDHERQLKEAQSLARIGNWEVNRETGARSWSDEIFRIMGYEPGSFEPDDQFINKIIHPDDSERFEKAEQWAKETGLRDIVYRVILPDGSVRHFHDLGKAEIDTDGKLIMLSGTVQDITDRVEAENKLRETEERFTFAVEGAGDGVWDWDLKTNAMHFSHLYLSMLGYGKDDLPSHVDSWLNNIHPEDLSRTNNNLHDYLEGRSQKYSLELRLRCQDNSYKWILCRGTIVSRDNKGQPIRMIGIQSDITNQKQNEQDLIDTREEAENANRAKTEFLSSMSHELRTPMNAIMGFGQLLNMEDDPPLSISQKENVDEIVKASHHLLELINEVLDLAKIESGRVDLSLEALVLAEVINESILLITPLAQRRGIEITLTKNGNDITFEQLLQDHDAIRADRIRFKQVILNLLSNAIKYNNENGKLIIDCTIMEGKFTRVSFTDTGNGLTEQQQSQLFKPFVRISDEQSNIEGVGIGLVITKNLIELMGGNIGLNSQPGVGSTFWVELPNDNLLPDQKSISNVTINQQFQDKDILEYEHTILYIEDNPANLRLVTQLLGRSPNIHIWNAHEPMLGLELAAEHKPDLILLDINLPRMNGFEVLKHLRQRSATRDTPVVAISANAMPSDIEQGMAAGFDNYITKPIDVNNLLNVVENILRKGK